MGGFGSGKWSDFYRRKTIVEMCNEISTKMLNENGFFDTCKTDMIEWKNYAGKVIHNAKVESFISVDVDKTSFIVLQRGVLSSDGHVKVVEQWIELLKWPCNYGGFRYYFVCPVVKNGVFCGNRSEKLYLPLGGQFFGCRECYDLTYESVQQNHKNKRLKETLTQIDLDNLNINQALRLSGL